MIIKISPIPVISPGLEFNASSYPGPGCYHEPVANMFYFVNHGSVSSVSGIYVKGENEHDERGKPQAAGISEPTVLKILALALKSEAAASIDLG